MNVDEKLRTFKSVNYGTSYTLIVKKFGIVRSMVANIKKNVSKLETFKKRTMEMGFKEATAKMMRVGEYKKLDNTPHIWFDSKGS